MSSLSAKDRASLCQFTFADGRRCRAPRLRNHPHFCFDHAQKEAKARATESLGKDLAYFFSGDYLSACDLSSALARLIPAVVRGDLKPRTARTVAYPSQTLLQTIHLSQDEYINAFGTDDWRKSIRNSVKGNHTHRFPPAPRPQPTQPQSPPLQTQPQQSAEPPVNCHSEPSEESAFSFSPASASPQPQPQQPAPSPHTPLPPTSAEFAQHVVAGLKTDQPQVPQRAAVAHPACHPPTATESARSVEPAAQPSNPPPTVSSTPKHTLPLDSSALHFDHNCRLLIDGKPF